MHTHAHANTHTHIHAHTCTHINTHTNTHTHARMHTHTHTHSLDVPFYMRRNITADNRAAGLSHVWNLFMYTSLTLSVTYTQ